MHSSLNIYSVHQSVQKLDRVLGQCFFTNWKDYFHKCCCHIIFHIRGSSSVVWSLDLRQLDSVFSSYSLHVSKIINYKISKKYKSYKQIRASDNWESNTLKFGKNKKSSKRLFLLSNKSFQCSFEYRDAERTGWSEFQCKYWSIATEIEVKHEFWGWNGSWGILASLPTIRTIFYN